MPEAWKTYHPAGRHRVLVTRELLGDRWLRILTEADCRVEVHAGEKALTSHELMSAFAPGCSGLIGQLAESMTAEIFEAFKRARGVVYSNYAVGYNNVDVPAASALGIAVGNTPGVLTGATAELAVALTFAAARRVVEADTFTRQGRFTGWGLRMFLGELLHGKTLGVVGLGRIGGAYARMLVQGQRMNLMYLSRVRKPEFEHESSVFNTFLRQSGETPVTVRRAESIEDLLRSADVVGLFPSLNESTRHLITADRLKIMRPNAILINASRGPVIDEAALVAHLQIHPDFRAGLDVYEHEPDLTPGLADLPNVILMPHIGSGTGWTREAMAVIAARNVAAVLQGFPPWGGPDISVFLADAVPNAAPSIVNASELPE